MLGLFTASNCFNVSKCRFLMKLLPFIFFHFHQRPIFCLGVFNFVYICNKKLLNFLQLGQYENNFVSSTCRLR